MKILTFFNILFSFLLGGVYTSSSSFINNLSTSSETITLGELIVDSYSDMVLQTNINLESRPMSSSFGPTLGREYNDPYTIIFFDMKTKDGRAIREVQDITLNITYNKPLIDYLPIPFEQNKTSKIKNSDIRYKHNPSIPSYEVIGQFPSLGLAQDLYKLEANMGKNYKTFLKFGANMPLNTYGKRFYVILPYAWDVNTVFISACAVTVDGQVINPSPEPQPDNSKIFNLDSMINSNTNIAITSDNALVDIDIPNTNKYDGKLKIGTYDFTINDWTNIKKDIDIKANLGGSYTNIELKNGDLISLKANFPVIVKVTLKNGDGTYANIIDNNGNLFPDINNESNKSWINDFTDFLKQVGIKFNNIFGSNLPFWLVSILILVLLSLLGPTVMIVIEVIKLIVNGLKYLLLGLKWLIIGPFKLFNYLIIPKKKTESFDSKYKYKR